MKTLRSGLVVAGILAFLRPTPAGMQGQQTPLFLPLVHRKVPIAVDGLTITEAYRSPIVLGMADDPRTGEILAATDIGVYVWEIASGRYRWLSDKDGLASNRVEDVAVDRDGNRWFASLRSRSSDGAPIGRGGLSRLGQNGSWRTFGEAEGLASDDMRAVITVPEGGVVVAGDYGFSRVSAEGEVTTIRHEFGGAWQGINDLAFEGETLWFATSHGVLEYRPDGTWTPRMTTFFRWPVAFDSVAVDLEGYKWLAGYPPQLIHLRGDLIPHDQVDCLKSTEVGIAVDSMGRRWFGCQDELFRLDPDGRSASFPYALPQPRSGRPVHVSAQDEVWVGGIGQVSRLEPDGSWHRLEVEVPPPGSQVDALRVDSNADLWIASSAQLGMAGRLSRFTNDGRWTHFDIPEAEDVAVRETRELLVAPDSTVLLVEAKALFRFLADGSWSRISLGDPEKLWLAGADFDPEGALWIANASGAQERAVLELRSDGRLRWHSTTDGIASNIVHDIAAGADGRIWAATSRGASVLDRTGRWKTFSDALSPGPVELRSVAVDSLGDLWFAASEGLWRYGINGRWQFIDESNGLPAGDVMRIEAGPEGIWVGGDGFVARRIAPGRWSVLKNASMVHHSPFAVDLDGRAWLGWLDGVAAFK